jgi:hypothetical protein
MKPRDDLDQEPIIDLEPVGNAAHPSRRRSFGFL